MACKIILAANTGGDRISILDDHPNPLPKCKRCGSQFPLGGMNTRHYVSESFKYGEEQRLRRNTLQRCFELIWVSFQINAYPLPLLGALPHLGRTISYNNIDWLEVFQNLNK